MKAGWAWGASLAAAVFFLGGGQAHAGSAFLVNHGGDEADLALNGTCDSSADPGEQCTLRAAIAESNSTPGSEDITFDIPAPGEEVATISPVTPLPAITAPVDIDGGTQPGAAENTRPFGKPLNTQIRVALDGSSMAVGPVQSGLIFDPGAATSSVRGLAIGSFQGPGINTAAAIEVAGNFIGTDATGTVAQPNPDGYFGAAGDGSVIGGAQDEDRNLISGNSSRAIGTNNGLTIEGNYIGTERDGKSPLGNGALFDSAAVGLYSTVSSVVKNNIIAHSGTDGVILYNGQASLISRNVMFGNNELGIDLNDDGVTLNDPAPDPDVGPNGYQNYPVIAAAARGHGKTNMLLRLDSKPDTKYTIEVFEADGNTRQGMRFVGKTKLKTDEDGRGSELLKAKKPGKGARVVATATNPNPGTHGATSEFSRPRKVK